MNFAKNGSILNKTARAPRVGGLSLKKQKELLLGALSLSTAFLLGICPLPLSVYPLGIAFFCASGKRALWCALGLLLASFFTPLDTVAYFLSALLTIALRVLTRMFIDIPMSEDKPCESSLFENFGASFFCESLPLRAAAASLGTFCLSLFPLVGGGFRYYDLFGALLSTSAGALCTLLFSGAFDRSSKKLHQKSAALVISAFLCLSLRSMPLGAVNGGLTAAFILTLVFCSEHGLPESCAAAILCGAVFSPGTCASLLICAFSAYCVLDVSHSLASAVACIAASICGIMLEGSVFMGESFLSFLLGCALFSAGKKLSIKRLYKSETASKQKPIFSESDCLSQTLLTEAAASLDCLCAYSPSITTAKAVLDAAQSEDRRESLADEKLGEAICRRLFELGFGRIRAAAIGKRLVKICLWGDSISGRRERLDFIKRRAEQICGFPLVIEKSDPESRTLLLGRENAISYHHALSFSSREEVCGDSAEVFYDSRRRLLHAVICDGMGSGIEASEISKKALRLLKALLLGGLSGAEASRELSKLLGESDGEEITTTADVLTLDLLDGRAALVKSGSAPSYIVRGGELIRLSARTLPAGILTDSDCQQIDFRLCDGDLFIMASDGVSECESDSIPLLKYLSENKSLSPEEIVKDIIDMSRSAGKEDDLTAIALKIFPYDY